MGEHTAAGNQIFQTLSAMEGEKKEVCIHCGQEWYAIHYKDGVCHTCQQKNLPGRKKQERINNIINYAKLVGILFIIMPIGMFISDFLGYLRLAAVVTAILGIILLFPFGFLKITFHKEAKK